MGSGNLLGKVPSSRELGDPTVFLKDLGIRSSDHRHVSLAELRETLTRAAALLSRFDMDCHSIIHHLVSLPFSIFTKQAIKFGISLWMGVINENPVMESRIMIEVASNWENSVRKQVGLFQSTFR